MQRITGRQVLGKSIIGIAFFLMFQSTVSLAQENTASVEERTGDDET